MDGQPKILEGARLPWASETTLEELSPNEWEINAVCSVPMPLDEVEAWANQWFAPPGSAEEKTAQALCELCPVRQQCLALAMDRQETNGIWGGVQFAPVEVRLCGRELHEMTSSNVRLVFVKGKAYPKCRACDNAGREARREALVTDKPAQAGRAA